jgi:TolB-like protein/tetratricopeptide (TPR) repeat protein
VAGPIGFFAELKRRHVVRAGVLYIGAVWALAQGIAQLTPVVGAPDWAARWFLVAAAIGFPFWLVFAWVFELTSHGLVREDELPPDPARVHSTARKLDFAIIAVLSVAVVLLLANTFVWRKGAGLDDAADLSTVPPKSVAVLPLANESGDPKQDYFSDGLSEELISDLTQINGLKVIGKTSSFRFRKSNQTPLQIGAALGVANLIEGSVRQSGQRLSVVIDMVRARDGTSVWSHTFDRDLKDVFAIQSEIGAAVANALKVKLLGKPIVSEERPPSGSVVAYRAMLQGRAIARQGTQDAYRQGIALLERSLSLDPRYAYVYGLLSNYWINLGSGLTGPAQQQAFAKGRAAANREFELAPNSASAHLDRAYVLSVLDLDQMAALSEYKQALALAPADETSMAFLALQLGTVGRWQDSADLYKRALVDDPLRPDWYAILADDLIMLGRLDEAEKALRTALGLQADFPGLHQQLVVIDVLRNDFAAARRDAALETAPDYKTWATVMAMQIGGDPSRADSAMRDYQSRNASSQPYVVASLYAIRREPDKVFEWLDRAWKQHDTSLAVLFFDPFILRYRDDPRFGTLSAELGLSSRPAGGKAPPGASQP